jgi:hypothetical protein
MAKIKLGAFITEIAGKVGGTVFSRNKGGAYAKNRVMPSNPRTTAQQNIRGFFGAMAQQWRALTINQRESWKELAANFNASNALGDAIKLSGIALFQKLNGNLRSLTLPPILTAPALGGTDPITINNFGMGNDGAGNLTTSLSVAALATAVPDTEFAVFATPPYSVGISNVNNKFRLIGNFPTIVALNTANSLDIYEGVFGMPPVGSQVSIRILPINSVTGENGTPVQASTIVAAT